MIRRWLPCVAVVVILTATLSCVCGQCEEGKKNKELVAEAFAIVQSGDLDRLDEYIAADYVRHCQAMPDVEITSLAAFKEYLLQDRETVPDPQLVLLRLVAEDDLVAFWATYKGTQEGPMGPYPATGKTFELDFAGMHRLVDGKIVETWVTWDNLATLTQLGFFPPEPQEATE